MSQKRNLNLNQHANLRTVHNTAQKSSDYFPS